MNELDKQKRLLQIPQEANLRELLMNLLGEMGLEPVLTHGIQEAGKDIVCRESNVFGMVEWIAFVVKLGKITGSAAGKGSLQTVLNQVQESFMHPYADQKTRTKVYMSKVMVVTNDEIISTAREKVLDKIYSLPTLTRANVHFIDGVELAKLLDARWPAFWHTHLDTLTESDPMSRQIGEILYVVALAHTHHARPTKKKPSHLAQTVIAKQTGLGPETVAAGLEYLKNRQYLEGNEEDGFTLDHKLTAGRLLTSQSHIRLLRLLDSKANSTRHFSLEQAQQVAAKLQFNPAFVKKAIELFVRGGYLERDEGRGKSHYIINDGMLEDEKTYLDSWLEYKGALPKQHPI